MHDPRRPHRGVARNPIVHGLSKREKKKKRAKCREFVVCLQSTTASRVRLHTRIPPSYPVECDCLRIRPAMRCGCERRNARIVRRLPGHHEISRDRIPRNHARGRAAQRRPALPRTRLAPLLARKRRVAVRGLRDLLAARLRAAAAAGIFTHVRRQSRAEPSRVVVLDGRGRHGASRRSNAPGRPRARDRALLLLRYVGGNALGG